MTLLAADRAPDAPGRSRDAVTTWLSWWRSRGAATQGVVPGLYVWAVTIAPVGWASGSPTAAAGATTLGLLVLLAGPLVERRSAVAARVGLGWGVVASALLTWALVPEAAVDGFDAARGISGMLGWVLFAFSVASPARPASRAGEVSARPRRKSPRTDTLALFVAVALAIALEVPGWRGLPRDRALLVRLVAVAGGLWLVATGSAIVLGPRARDASPSRPMRLRDLLWLAAAGLLMGGGATYQVWLRP